jgi:pimeloyl-ACP methyl ester carboxylesterase
MIKTTLVNNHKIEYLDIGKGKTLIFLHGAFSSFRFYKPLLNKLAIKYHVLAPVLPGMGKSSKIQADKKNEILPEFLETLHSFISKEVKTKEYILVGHSLGGYLALRLVTEYGLKPQRIIMINSPSKSLEHYYTRTIKGWSGVGLEHLKHLNSIGVKNLIPIDVLNMLFKRPAQFVKVFKALDTLQSFNKSADKLSYLTIFSSKDDTYVPHDHALDLASRFKEANLITIKKGGHAWFYYEDKPLVKELIK